MAFTLIDTVPATFSVIFVEDQLSFCLLEVCS